MTLLVLIWTHSNRTTYLCWWPQRHSAPEGCHQSRVERQNHLSLPSGSASFDAAQDVVGFLGCKHTLLSHTWLVPRVSFDPFSPSLYLCLSMLQSRCKGLQLVFKFMRFCHAQWSINVVPGYFLIKLKNKGQEKVKGRLTQYSSLGQSFH